MQSGNQSRRAQGLLVWLVLGLAAMLAGIAGGTALAQAPDRPAYRLEVDLDYGSATLQAQQTTRFRNSTGQPLDEVVFQVTPAYSGAYQPGAASAQGQPVAPSLNGTVLEVPLPTAAGPGETIEVSLSYTLDIPRRAGRFSAGPRAIALGNWFPALAPHRGEWDRHQYTEVGDAFATEVADFDVQLTTSVPLVVASSGRVTEDSGTSFRIQALGVRDFGLSLSPDYSVTEATVGSATVRAYTFGQARGKRFAESAARFLRWYGQKLGDYPYRAYSLADVELPASYGGMEYPGLVFISAALGAPENFEGSQADYLIGHETAHQWFYSLVGNDQVADPWLDEAFATYLPLAYYRATLPGIYSSLWSSQVLAGSAGKPLSASVYDFPDDSPYYVAVYRQGARFLDELRRSMGDAAFEAAMREHVSVFADKLATPRAVLDLYQLHSQANLNPLVSRYFEYGAFSDPSPAAWRVEAPPSPWRDTVPVFVGAEFPLTWVEVWLDNRRLYSGGENSLSLDLDGVEPGEYVLLVRVWDHREAQFERAQRVSVTV